MKGTEEKSREKGGEKNKAKRNEKKEGVRKIPHAFNIE